MAGISDKKVTAINTIIQNIYDETLKAIRIAGDISVSIDPGDINIGSVEIKNATSDDRMKVHPDGSIDVNVIESVLPDGAAQEHVDADDSHSVRLTDGSAFYDARDIRLLTVTDVVTAEQGGLWDINDITGTISLPEGAATETTLDLIRQKTDNIPANPATDRTSNLAPFAVRLATPLGFYKAIEVDDIDPIITSLALLDDAIYAKNADFPLDGKTIVIGGQIPPSIDIVSDPGQIRPFKIEGDGTLNTKSEIDNTVFTDSSLFTIGSSKAAVVGGILGGSDPISGEPGTVHPFIVNDSGELFVKATLRGLVSLTNNFANPAIQPVGSFNMLRDGTTWDMQPGDSAGGAFVQGPGVSGATPVGNPVLIGGFVGGLNTVQTMRVTSSGRPDVSVNDSALPSGAATSANQSTIITSLQLIDDVVFVDNAGFTDGTSKLNAIGFIFDEVAGTSLTENDIAAARIDSKRAIINVIEDATTRGQRLSISAGGAIKTELPTAVALADNTSNPTVPGVGAFLMGWDVVGSNWDRAQTATPSLDNVAAASFPGLLTTSLGYYFNGSTFDRIRGNTSGSFTIGNVAHDAVDAANPVKMGGRASDAILTAVANADRTDAIFDRVGRQVVKTLAQRTLSDVETTTITNSAAETTIVTAVASEAHDITKLIFTQTAGVVAPTITIKDSTGGTTRVVFQLPLNQTLHIDFAQLPFKQKAGANQNWTATLSSNAVTVSIMAVFAKESVNS